MLASGSNLFERLKHGGGSRSPVLFLTQTEISVQVEEEHGMEQGTCPGSVNVSQGIVYWVAHMDARRLD